MQTHDVVIIGGGPAGSTAARFLVQGGLRVVVVDRARFPRVKLCAGWLSLPIWEALQLSPTDYAPPLWPWSRCHVHHAGEQLTLQARGYFVRRCEFDDFLLRTSGAEVVQDHHVRALRHDSDGTWVMDDRLRARYLIGAGGTHCPVARGLFPKKVERAVGAQEREFSWRRTEVERCRLGLDGEPELLLHDDLRGYSWNVPKSEWLNLGTGTVDARDVRGAWQRARRHFDAAGHLPEDVAAELDAAEGHSYHLFHPQNLASACRDNAFLVGDALGLAQPVTAEGILPAVLSGRLCAEAILKDQPHDYARLLREHPLMIDYAAVHRLRQLAARLRAGRTSRSASARSSVTRGAMGRLKKRVVARGFAWMFSGQRLPAQWLWAGLVRPNTAPDRSRA